MRRAFSFVNRVFFITMALLLSALPILAAQDQSSGNVKRSTPSTPGAAGPATCQSCHAATMKNLGRTTMGRIFLKHPRSSSEEMACETCHGLGEDHANSGGSEFGDMIRFQKGSPTPVEKRNAACFQCHEKKKLLFWSGSPHEARDVACVNCHKVHPRSEGISNRHLLAEPMESDVCSQCHKQQAAQQMRFSHHPLREGKMQCSSCHNPHGAPSAKLLKANSINDLCYGCHTEKRGPFLFEHPPVMEECSNCHAAHGSNHPRLLKVPEFRVCRQCHINFHALNTSGLSPGHITGRLCTDCHTNFHGSNHPTGRGNLFLR